MELLFLATCHIKIVTECLQHRAAGFPGVVSAESGGQSQGSTKQVAIDARTVWSDPAGASGIRRIDARPHGIVFRRRAVLSSPSGSTLHHLAYDPVCSYS